VGPSEGVVYAGANDSVAFQTASGVPWTWSCASCAARLCSIVAPNIDLFAAAPNFSLFATPPSSACSGAVQLGLSTSPLAIGDGPGNYPDNTDCTWVVSASGPITVRFSEFASEPGYDHVKLYDGASTSAPLLQSYSGVALPGAVTSTGGSLTVRFTSDSSTLGVNTSGFTAILTSASVKSALRLVGTVPAVLGDLQCIDSVASMCACSCNGS
jgi:hypothetical protein